MTSEMRKSFFEQTKELRKEKYNTVPPPNIGNRDRDRSS